MLVPATTSAHMDRILAMHPSADTTPQGQAMTAVEPALSTRFAAASIRLNAAINELNLERAQIEWRFIHRLLDQILDQNKP